MRGKIWFSPLEFFTVSFSGIEQWRLEEVTEDIMAIHSSDVRKQPTDFHVGTQSISKKGENEESSVFLLHPKWKIVALSMTKNVSKDGKTLQFRLTDVEQDLRLPSGHHVWVPLRRKFAYKERSEILGTKTVQSTIKKRLLIKYV